MKRAGVILFFIGFLFLAEPLFRGKVIFAVTYFDNSAAVKPDLSADHSGQTNKTHAYGEAEEKSRAPEPSSLILLIGGISGIVVRFARKSFDKFKRAADIILSLGGLLVLSPLLAMVAVGIKLTSKGPVIYRQDRVGQNGKVFRIYKLRSMRQDAEANSGAVWAKENDPRITPFGRILRKAHIDEIPQLLNVLTGEMSIVGPRPERPELVRDLKTVIKDYELRLQIKPGITGLAQVWHKYDETVKDVKKKIKYDILYMKKMCLLVDLRILAQTCVVVLTGKGAR